MNDLIAEDCVVCGRRAQSRHHEPPKGMGGTRIKRPVLSLCCIGNEDATTCHGARHHSDLKLEKHNGVWYFIPNDRYSGFLQGIGLAVSANERNVCRCQ